MAKPVISSSSSSSSSNQGDLENHNSEKSKRPPDIKFLQQTLPAEYPVLNAGFIFPIFLGLSIIFIPLGVGIYLYAENIQEVVLEYSNCTSLEEPRKTCEQVITQDLERRRRLNDAKWFWDIGPLEDCKCRLDFEIKEPMDGTVYIYYALSNFYQNNLNYFRSRDVNQFKGDIVTIDKSQGPPYKYVANKPSSLCEPLDYDSLGRAILPCGLQANSMFFDEISFFRENGESVPLLKTGIAWDSDKDKFNNPPQLDNISDPIWKLFGKPPSWKKHIWELDSNKSNNGFENEDFINWMKTAAFPYFRKLHRIVNHNALNSSKKGLEPGKYSFLIEYNTPVKHYDGTKSIILTNSRESAGKNYFLAGAYFVTGTILFVLSIFFFVLHLYTKEKYLELKMD